MVYRILILLVVSGAYGWFEIKNMQRSQQNRRAVWAFLALLLFAVVLVVLYMFQLPVPNPGSLVRLIFQPLGKWVMKPV